MLQYIVKRIILALITIFVIITITFFAMNSIPGGPFDSEKALNPQVELIMKQRFHLDKPLIVQYFIYIGNVLRGDFGVSIKTGRNISDIILSNFVISFSIGFRSILFALFFGLIFGCISAFCKDKWQDRTIMFFSTLFVSIPNFIFATLLLLIFCVVLKWIPVWSPDTKNYILPIISLGIYPLANIVRLTRTSMIEALNQDYIRTARAKGLSTTSILFKHALRNASIPVLTYIGPMTAFVLTGSFVIETVFSIGGLGMQFVNSITNRDYSLILGTTIFLAILIVVVSLISDILYKILDPRITLE